MMRLMCLGRTVASTAEYSVGEAEAELFLSLHVPVFSAPDAVDVVVESEPESESEEEEDPESELDEESDPLSDAPTNAATLGPGKVYFDPGLNTSGSKMPGSLSL